MANTIQQPHRLCVGKRTTRCRPFQGRSQPLPQASSRLRISLIYPESITYRSHGFWPSTWHVRVRLAGNTTAGLVEYAAKLSRDSKRIAFDKHHIKFPPFPFRLLLLKPLKNHRQERDQQREERPQDHHGASGRSGLTAAIASTVARAVTGVSGRTAAGETMVALVTFQSFVTFPKANMPAAMRAASQSCPLDGRFGPRL